MASIYYTVKVLAALWIAGMFFIFATSGNSSEKDDHFSSYVLFATVSAFFPTIQYATRQGENGTGAFSVGSPYVSYAGFLLIAIACVVHALGIFTLKKQWSTTVVVREDHQLIETGLYKFIRHPIYAAILLELLGFGLALSNWLAILFLIVPNLAGFAYRIHVEEKVLRKHFGQAYVLYEQHTKRLMPWVF